MATERKRSSFPGDVSWRWTANVTVGEERHGGSAAGQGAQRRDGRSLPEAEAPSEKAFIRIDEGAETDNGDRGWGGVSKAELANT